MSRKYMGVRFQGKVYRFSVFSFDKLMQKLGGYLPSNFYAYHFNKKDVVKYDRYMKLEPLNHADGNSLGAFSHDFVISPKLRDDNGILYELIDHRWEVISG